MAGATFRLPKRNIALVAATDKDVLHYAVPTGQRAILKDWGVDFDGVNASANMVIVQLVVLSTPHTTGTDVSAAAAPTHAGAPTVPRGVFRQAATGGTDRANNPYLDQHMIHPTSAFSNVLALGEEYRLEPGVGIAIRCNAPAAVNVAPYLLIEE